MTAPNPPHVLSGLPFAPPSPTASTVPTIPTVSTAPIAPAAPILSVQDLHVRYRTARGDVDAVQGVSFDIGAGEVVAVVGESGSGKTTTAHAVIGLLGAAGSITGGRILLAGDRIDRLPERAMNQLRGARIGLVPQDPAVSLNPVQRIGVQVAEVLRIHEGASRRSAAARAAEVLQAAGLDDPEVRAAHYPHQLSGGMRQRVLIGIALACRPDLLIADEPTSALDVTVQRTVLDHLQHLTTSHHTAVLFITHDLAVAADRADRILVMHRGRIVEQGPAHQVLTEPEHDYTRTLLAAAPSLRGGRLSATAVPRRPVPGADRKLHGATSLDGAVASDPSAAPVLVAEHLVREFRVPRSTASERMFRAVDDVSFSIAAGSTFSLVGESGSGKSTTARMVGRLTEVTAGRVLLGGEDITTQRGAELRRLRRRMQLVYQNPYDSLDPRLTVSAIIAEPLRAFGVPYSERAARVGELIDEMALPASLAHSRPAELSGGQRQRVAIARAIALRPELVILDEPVSALDVSVQAQILQLLAELQAELGLSYLFISHDLAVVRQISDVVAVMRHGRIVETGPTESLFANPHHAYTRDLLAAIPGNLRRR